MEAESFALKIPLTEEEQRDLTRREQYIEENLQTLFSMGKAFADIRDRKLYRETHRTFEDYCKERWQISRPRAYQLIDASVVHEHLSTNVDKNVPLPTNEAQTRALKHVPVEKQPELWSKAVNQNNGNPPTAKQVIQVIENEIERRDCPKCRGKGNVPAGNYVCCFCGEWYFRDQLFWGIDDVTICRKCAAKAQIDLLHPNDQEVIAECSQQWNNTAFEPRRTGDLDKIMRSGIFRIFRIDDYAKTIKEYTKAKSTIAEGIEAITWGSWKTFEKFETKKAMYERAAELQQDEHVIFEGKAT